MLRMNRVTAEIHPNILRQARTPNILQGSANVEITKTIWARQRLAKIDDHIANLALLFPPLLTISTTGFKTINMETALGTITASVVVVAIAVFFKIRNLDEASRARKSLSPPR